MYSLFDQTVDRSGPVTWLKDLFTPEAVREAGLLGYAGAEFEFPTCPAISRSICALLDKGLLGFTLPNDAYREAVCRWMEQVRGSRVEGSWIVPTHGTIFSLATLIRLLTKPGESIVILTPGYHRYAQAATRLSRGTVRVPLAENNGVYAMDWDALEKALAVPENRILVLTNPNNPTGTVFTREELSRLAALCRQYQVAVFSDEIFADVTFGGKTAAVYAAVAEETDLAVSCTALGKTFSLTGINQANVLIKNPVLREQFLAQRNRDHYGSLDPLHAAALLGAYSREGREWVEQLRGYVWQNYLLFRDYILSRFPQALVTEPEGSYVVWVDFAGTGKSPQQLEQLLCREGLFVGDPGEDFDGKHTCFRYSLAVPRQELVRSLQYLDRAVTGL